MKPYGCVAWVALIALLALAGCSSTGSDLPVLLAKPEVSSYRLGPGDRLEIRVLAADELNGQYSVRSRRERRCPRARGPDPAQHLRTAHALNRPTGAVPGAPRNSANRADISKGSRPWHPQSA
jgi:protein involved in polysaccharide export with SLBB domain